MNIFAFTYQELTPDERRMLSDLNNSGDLRDQIFMFYVEKQFIHEREKYKRKKEKFVFTLDEVNNALGSLAMHSAAESGNVGVNIITHSMISQIIDKDHVDAFIDLAIRLNILFASDGKLFRFAHLLLFDTFAFIHSNQCISQNNHQLRHKATKALARLADPRSLEILISVATDRPSYLSKIVSLGMWGEKIQTDAIKALGILGDRRAVEPLNELLKQWSVIEPVAKSLGELGDSRAVYPLLKSASQNYVPVLVTVAVEVAGLAAGLAAGRPTGTQGALVQRFTKHKAAMNAIIAIGPKAIEPLVAALTDENAGIAYLAADTLGKLKGAQATQALTLALSDKRRASGLGVRRVADAAAEALKQIGTDEAKIALDKFRSH